MPALKKHNPSHQVPILSFFTGAGFLDIGFLQNGFKGVWHNEYHPAFVSAFENGLSTLGYKGCSARVQNTNSIVDIGPNEILREAFGTVKPPSLYGVIGGPPCPDFSVGGKNRGHMGDNGRLSEVYVNRILELNPTFFLFENVPGLLRTAKHRDFLVKLLIKLQARYALDLRILNALDFGVPQDRERVFIVGFQKKWLKKQFSSSAYKHINEASEFLPLLTKLKPKEIFAEVTHWFPWPVNSHFQGAKYKFNWPTKPVPLGHSPAKPDCPDELMVGTYICNEDRLALPNSSEGFQPKSAKFNTTLEGDVSRKSFKRLHRYKFSPAAAYGNNEVHLHPTLPRRLTVREAMMIQTVPNGYIMPDGMSLSDKFKTIGNGVPVKLADAMASSIAEFISGEYKI